MSGYNSGPITTTAGGIGYTTGAGGTATQVTSKSTGVTLNTLSGEITMEATTSIGASASITFTLTNSQIGAHDAVIVNIAGGSATPDKYLVQAANAAAGSVLMCVRNTGAAALAEPLVLRFAIIKAVNA